MPIKSNVVKSLLVALLTICCIWMGMVCFTPSRSKIGSVHFPNDNELFLSIQQRYERHLEHTILKLLEPLVGRGKVQVSVQIDLDLKNARHNVQSYHPHTQEVVSTQTFEKEIQNRIRKQHISVVVDGNIRKGGKGIYQPRTPQEMASYRQLIQSVVGYNISRGDTLEIQNMPFESRISSQRSLLPLLLVLSFVILALMLIISPFLCVSKTATKETDTVQFSPDMLDKITQNPARAITVIKNWIYMPPNKNKVDWTPIQKVGIVLLALDENIVRQILIALDDNEVRQVAKTMTTLGVIPPQESARILAELYEAMTSGSAVVGNPIRVQQILSESTSEATLKFKETLQTPHSSLWEELAGLQTSLLASRLIPLRPEITAYILYRFSAEKASDILQQFPESKASQVLIHLSHIGHISPTTNTKMEQETLNIARDILNTIHTPTGTEKTSEIISQLSKTQNGQAVIKDINEKEPLLAKKLALKLVRFDDLAHWSDQNIQTLLRHTLRATAVTALINVSEGVKHAIFRNIPKSLSPQLEADILDKQKHAKLEDIQKARQEVVENIRTLLTQGKIQL